MFSVLFVCLFIFVISLFFREQRIPSFVIDKISDYVSSRRYIVRCDSAAFGFRHGLRLSGVRLYDMMRANSLERPIVAARVALVDYFGRLVRIVGAEYARLPDSYYEPTTEVPKPDPIEFEMPEAPEFRLVLESPSILGICPEEVSARIRTRRRRLEFGDVSVSLPDRDCSTRLKGDFALDLDAQKAAGELHGAVKQSQIRPFLEVMDVPSALPYMDAFTEVPEPVPSSVKVEVDLPTGDLDLKIDLRPKMGRYNGVAMDRAEGGLDVQTRLGESNRTFRVKVNLPLALDNEGRKLSGWLAVADSSGQPRLEFDVKSDLAFEDAVNMVGLLDPAKLKILKCDTAPHLVLAGTSGTSADDLDANAITGTATLVHGAIDGFRVSNLSASYALKRDILDLDVKATGKTGGMLSWQERIDLVGFDGDARFSSKGSYVGGSLEELADALSFDLGERNGRVDMDMELSGLADVTELSTLNGKGSLKITDGHLAQMKLFAGLTELLADKIPGVSFLVNQTQASTDFTITNGVFVSNNVYIEGGLVSLKGWGQYDMVADNLDFTVRVQFLKNESLMGKIVHPVTFPFTKLLLEFKVDGPIDEPKWRYIKILDRIF